MHGLGKTAILYVVRLERCHIDKILPVRLYDYHVCYKKTIKKYEKRLLSYMISYWLVL